MLSVIKVAAEIYVAAFLSVKESLVNMIVFMFEFIVCMFMVIKCVFLFELIVIVIEVVLISLFESGTSELLLSVSYVGATLSVVFF